MLTSYISDNNAVGTQTVAPRCLGRMSPAGVDVETPKPALRRDLHLYYDDRIYSGIFRQGISGGVLRTTLLRKALRLANQHCGIVPRLASDIPYANPLAGSPVQRGNERPKSLSGVGQQLRRIPFLKLGNAIPWTWRPNILPPMRQTGHEVVHAGLAQV